MPQGPLVGLKIVDLTTVVAGNFTCSMMADFGAEVIKAEHPDGGDPSRRHHPIKNGVSLPHKVLGRNKKCITLNLSKPEGQKLLLKLVADADILIENFRPGTLEKWNLGWDVLEKVNPRLVLLRISGYGQTGPYATRPGFGTIGEAMAGLPFRTGMADGPPIFSPFPQADIITGLFGTFSTMFAIYHRDHGGTGRGQVIDIGLFESVFRLMEDQVISFDQLGMVFERMGNRSSVAAPRGAFKSADGHWIAISGFTESKVKSILRAIGGEPLLADPRFQDNLSRVKHVEALEAIISEWVGRHTEEEALRILQAHDVVASGVYDIRKIFSDPQYAAREDIITVQDPDLGAVRVPGIVPKFSLTPGAVEHLDVPLGHHNEEIYCGRLGMGSDALEKLREDKVI